jgi:hypothetical protein
MMNSNKEKSCNGQCGLRKRFPVSCDYSGCQHITESVKNPETPALNSEHKQGRYDNPVDNMEPTHIDPRIDVRDRHGNIEFLAADDC